MWRDNKEVQNLLVDINSMPIIVDTEQMIIQLPNAEQLVNSHYGNREALTRAFQDCVDIIHSLGEKAIT